MQAYLKGLGYRTAIVGKYLNSWDVTVDPPFFDRWSNFSRGFWDGSKGYTGLTFNVEGKVRRIARYSQLMRAAVSDRRIWFDPCQDVPLPSERHNEQRFLSAPEVERLAGLIDERFRALVYLAAYGGLRFGELAGLRRGRMDLVRGRVSVVETLVEANGQFVFGPPKTKRSRRTVPLPRRIVSDLEMHTNRFVEPGPEALVFLGPKAGPLRRAGFRRRWWVPATEAAGFPGLKFHELRHTFVALWIAAGAGAKEISTRAGHSSVAFTLDRYGHLYEDAEDEIPERLDALLFQRLAPHTRPRH